MKKKLLFIPAYNCEKQILRLLQKFQNEDIKIYDKILIIDNASEDKTSQNAKQKIVEKKFQNFLVIKNNKNYGLGGSHKIAFKYAMENDYEYCCVIHGDDQGDICDLNRVVKQGEYTKYACVRAGRFKNGSKLYGYSLFRILGNKAFKYIYSIMIKKKIHDIGAGLAIYKMSEIKKTNYEYFVNDMSFDSFMILILDYYQLKFDFFNVTWREEDQVSNTKLFKTAIKILKNLISYSLNKRNFIKKLYSNKVDKYQFETIFES